MNISSLYRRFCAIMLALLLVCITTALPAFAADVAPYAEDGDLDYIRNYIVTVDLQQDGSAEITYDIDWQVVAGDKSDYLTWVQIGLPNAHAEDLTPLTDTISQLDYVGDNGSYAKVVFARRYYSPEVAAANGGESSVHFAFRVHQSHLFTLNDDGTADFDFTPGWFDDLCVEHMQVRWHGGEGFVADNTGTDGDYLTWDFGPLGHGQAGNVHVTVPVTCAADYDPDAALTASDYNNPDDDGDIMMSVLILFAFVLLFIFVVFCIVAAQPGEWGGGFGADIDPDDWFWYTNGVHTIRRARTAPPPAGYHRTAAPKNYRTGGGHSRGGGTGRHNSGCASSCACACASSCACACACAGGGRAGCSVKDLYTVKLPAKKKENEGAL